MEPTANTPHFRRYLIGCAAAFGLSALAVVLFCLWSDAFGIYRMPAQEGWNHFKPAFDTNARMSKAQIISRASHYKGLILGSSTAEVGLDPEHAAWKEKPVFNLALSAGNLYEAREYLQEAVKHNPISEVVLQTDLLMFSAHLHVKSQLENTVFFGHSFSDQGDVYIKTLFSWYGVHAAWRNIVRSEDAKERGGDIPYMENGQRGWRYFEHKLNNTGGHRDIFMQKNREILTGSMINGRRKIFSFRNSDTGANTLEYFKDIVEFCARHHIRLHVVVPPTHAYTLLAYERAGYGPLSDAWKRRMTEILAPYEEKYPGQFSLWDFGVADNYTTETIPPFGNTAHQMEYYWEGIHYKTQLGDKLLARVLSGGKEGPKDFGVRLTTENIETSLKKNRTALADYRRTHPKESAEIDTLLKDIAPQRDGLVIELPE